MGDMDIKAGDRVIEKDGGKDPIRADVRGVSKDGSRIRVQFWGRGMREGKLTTMWTYAQGWVRS